LDSLLPARRPLRFVGYGGRGQQVRDFLHPRDVASLVWQQLCEPDRRVPRILNVSAARNAPGRCCRCIAGAKTALAESAKSRAKMRCESTMSHGWCSIRTRRGTVGVEAFDRLRRDRGGELRCTRRRIPNGSKSPGRVRDLRDRRYSALRCVSRHFTSGSSAIACRLGRSAGCGIRRVRWIGEGNRRTHSRHV
jgi:hypothetical protein